LLKIYNKMPDTDKAHHTLVMLGIFYYCKERYDEAVETFTLCQKQCPEYKKTVASYLAEAIEKRRSETVDAKQK